MIRELVARIRRLAVNPVTIMEVCGSHTMAIHKFGIHSLLPQTIKLLSGPGCPVCVSGIRFMDHAIGISRLENVITVTYGDLLRVPGTEGSLEKEKATGADIRIIYSVLDALEIAKKESGRLVVFPAIGFETTAPSTAAAIIKAKEEGIRNFFVLSSHKVMPPVLEALVNDDMKIDGFIAPGHVSAITGSFIYRDIAEKYHRGIVVSGFEPVDILQSIEMLVRQVESHKPKVEIQYSRVVKPEGNPRARGIMDEVFEPGDEEWRGFGMIPLSGLKLRKNYQDLDAGTRFDIRLPQSKEPAGCRCGDVLRGIILPNQCPLFATNCTPENPIGACMVSSEGTCAAYYKYRTHE